MRTLFILLALATAHLVSAQPVPMGKITKLNMRINGFTEIDIDGAGNVYVKLTFQNLKVFSKDGSLIKEIPSTSGESIVHSSKLKEGVILRNATTDGFTIRVLDPHGKLKFAKDMDSHFVKAFELKNGNILICSQTLGNKLKPNMIGTHIFSPTGTLLSEAKYEGVVSTYILTGDEGVVFGGKRRLTFLGPDLKIRGTYEHKEGPPDPRTKPLPGLHFYEDIKGHLSTDDRVVACFRNKLLFFDFNGNLKSEFVSSDPEGFFQGMTALPGNMVLGNAKDGYSYILDSQGQVKYKHHHESDVVSSPLYIGNETAVYWNRSEIVFLDLQGNEKGTLPLERSVQLSKYFVANVGLAKISDGSFIAWSPSSLNFINPP